MYYIYTLPSTYLHCFLLWEYHALVRERIISVIVSLRVGIIMIKLKQ